MITLNVLELQQSLRSIALPGCWKLMPGQVISLRPREAGALRIAQGQVWATFDGPPTAHRNELGDHFLTAGQQITLCPGKRLVFEPWGGASDVPVYFEWTPVWAINPVGASRAPAALMEPARDLAQALSMAGCAFCRLLAGLTGFQRRFEREPGPRRHKLG